MLEFVIGSSLVLVGFWVLRIVLDILKFYYRRSKAVREVRYLEKGVVMNPKTGKLMSQRKPDV